VAIGNAFKQIEVYSWETHPTGGFFQHTMVDETPLFKQPHQR